MNTSGFLFGIEFETAMAEEVADAVEIGEYHDGIIVDDYWTAEEDGSLSGEEGFPYTAEFVSKPIKYSEIEKAWESLAKTIRDRTGYRFHEAFSVNRTCGLHMHISHKKYPIGRLPVWMYTRVIRGRFFKGIEKEFGKVKAFSIRRQYFRSYASEVNELLQATELRSRYHEFNLSRSSHNDEKNRIEWRSLNGYGLKYLDEFIRLSKLAARTVMKSVWDFFNGRAGDVKIVLALPEVNVQRRFEIKTNAR